MQTDEEVGKVAQAVPVIIYILLTVSLSTDFLKPAFAGGCLCLVMTGDADVVL